MFESDLIEQAPPAAALRDEDWFDPAWLDEATWPDSPPEPQPPASACVPSGWLALELDQSTSEPARLSDTELIDMIVGLDRVSSWASARQAGLLAEFAHRRPADDSQPTRSEVPRRCSEFAPDEIGLALRLSRTTAANRVTMAQVLVADLPATLAAWQDGRIDVLKARAITETSYLLPTGQRRALEARVLPRAGTQTLSQLRAALARAVLVLDPDGAAVRHEQRRAERQVVLGADGDGMATLWALLSAPDATAAYQRLCQLARSLGADDPRGMDARRADLLIDLLTGRRCAATATPLDTQDCAHPDGPYGCDCTPSDCTPGADSPRSASRADHTPTACCDATGAGSGPGKPLISVIVPLSTLLGLDEHPGELAGHGPIPAHIARELAADGTWRRLLTDPASGVLLDYGRTTYTPPAGLADFVRARDLYCRNPICGQRAATADLDHTVPWPEGGTSEYNLYTGCRHCHRLKTLAPGWQIEQHPDGQITWTTPTGHTYTSHPHDYRPDPHPPPAATPGAPRAGPRPGIGAAPSLATPDTDRPPF